MAKQQRRKEVGILPLLPRHRNQYPILISSRWKWHKRLDIYYDSWRRLHTSTFLPSRRWRVLDFTRTRSIHILESKSHHPQTNFFCVIDNIPLLLSNGLGFRGRTEERTSANRQMAVELDGRARNHPRHSTDACSIIPIDYVLGRGRVQLGMF
jgi:hypothetical protein